jgi:hypothetical protein
MHQKPLKLVLWVGCCYEDLAAEIGSHAGQLEACANNCSSKAQLLWGLSVVPEYCKSRCTQLKKILSGVPTVGLSVDDLLHLASQPLPYQSINLLPKHILPNLLPKHQPITKVPRITPLVLPKHQPINLLPKHLLPNLLPKHLLPNLLPKHLPTTKAPRSPLPYQSINLQISSPCTGLGCPDVLLALPSCSVPAVKKKSFNHT